MRQSHLKPAAPRFILHLMAGLMWACVGIMLLRLALGWLWALHWQARVPYLLAGASAAAIIQFFFGRLALKNIRRVDGLGERPCIFAFQAWTSYPLVAFMICLGLFLRHSPLPKPLLAVLYIGIGGGLFLAGLRYFQHLFVLKAITTINPDPDHQAHPSERTKTL